MVKYPIEYAFNYLDILFINVWSFYDCAIVTKSRWIAVSNMEEEIDIRDQMLLISILCIFLWVLFQTFFVCLNDRFFCLFEMLDLLFVRSLFKIYFIWFYGSLICVLF